MKFIGHFKDFTESLKGGRAITLSVDNYVPTSLFEGLNQDISYQVEIKPYRSKRSLQQNSMLWKLISEIAQKTNQDDYEVYCALLERANALSDYVMTEKEISEEMKLCFRGVKFMRVMQINGKDRYIYKVYLGSSKMNTKEFTELLDEAIKLASEVGIYVNDY